MDTKNIDVMRRGIAAISVLMSGPTRFGFLDPLHVLIGAGPALTPDEKESLIADLAATGRHLIYQEYSNLDSEPSLESLHVASAGSKGNWWWSNCMYWTPGATGEVALVPFDTGARGHFVSRDGVLKYIGSRPAVSHEGIVHAAIRIAGIVKRLKPHDYAGQSREISVDGGVRYWQRQGFAIREQGKILSPEEAAENLSAFTQPGVAANSNDGGGHAG